MLDIAILLILFAFTMYKIELIKPDDEPVDNKLLTRNATTVLKGLSAFFVIAAHTHAWLQDSVQTITINKFTDIILTQLGGMGVLIFFFLSGYGIQEGYGKRVVDRTYIYKRIKNVHLPYVELKLFFTIAGLLTGSITVKDIPARLLGILTLEDWFIFVIVIEYFFYYVARKVLRQNYILLLLVLNIGLTIIFILQNRADRYINSMWLFLFGIILSMYQESFYKILKNHIIPVSLLSLMLFFITGAIFAINKGALWADIVKPISGMALCVFLICITHGIRLNSPFLAWGGRGRSTSTLYTYGCFHLFKIGSVA